MDELRRFILVTRSVGKMFFEPNFLVILSSKRSKQEESFIGWKYVSKPKYFGFTFNWKFVGS